MGLKELVDQQVSNALKAVGNLANIVNIVQHLPGGYDPATGTQVENVNTIQNITCVMPGFSADEKDDQIIVLTDKKGLIARLDLPVGTEINQNDELHQLSGGVVVAKWDVRRVLSVPGDSLYKLHLRKMR